MDWTMTAMALFSDELDSDSDGFVQCSIDSEDGMVPSPQIPA